MTTNKDTTLVPFAQDGGYAWIIVMGAFLAYFIADGWSYSFGALYPYILEYLQEGKGKTALIGALLYGLPFIVSPFVCTLTEYIGCRKTVISGGIILALSFVLSMFATSVNVLCLTLGVLGSVGLAMTYVPSLLIVTFYFEKHRGLATGLAVTGSGLGSSIMPPFVEYLIEFYGIKGTLLLLAGISLNIIVAGALFRPPKMVTLQEKVQLQSEEQNYLNDQKRNDTIDIEDNNDLDAIHSEANSSDDSVICKRYGSLERRSSLPTEEDTMEKKDNLVNNLKVALKSMFDAKLLLVWPFAIFCGSSFLTYLWSGVPYIYLVDYAMELGISSQHSVFLLSIIAIARTIGQLLLGFIGDLKQVNAFILYAVCITAVGVSVLVLPLCQVMSTLSIFSVSFGFFISVTYSLQMICVVLTVGVSRATRAFGMVQLIQGIATLLGTPVAGSLFNVFGDYNSSFYIAGACIMLSGLKLFVVPKSTLFVESEARKEEEGVNEPMDEEDRANELEV